MSPRSTHGLHERGDLEHLATVLFVGLQRRSLGGQLDTAPKAAGAVEDCPTYGVGSAHARRLKLRERVEGFGIQADTDGR